MTGATSSTILTDTATSTGLSGITASTGMSSATASMASTTTAADAGAELTGIAGWAVDVMNTLGGMGAAALIALENLFPPLPSEVILPLAGFTAGSGTGFSLLSAILWCTAGSVIGAWLLYGLGAWLGRERAHRLLARLPLVNERDVARTESWFLRRGHWTVFLGRMIPVFRSLISLPAGITRMKPLPFTLLTTAGSAIWNSVLITAGFLLGANWSTVESYVGIFSRVIVTVLLVGTIWWAALRIYATRRGSRPVEAKQSRPHQTDNGDPDPEAAHTACAIPSS